MNFGERLKQCREEKGLTQEQLGNEFNVKDATINRYEKNKREPGFKTLKKFAQHFNCSTDYLLGLTDHPKETTTRINVADEIYQKYLTDEQAEFIRVTGPVWVTLAAEFENEGLSADEVREIVTTVMKLTKDRQK